MTRRTVVAALVVALLAAACGGSKATTGVSERPLTFDEAAKFAAVQVDNYRAGGATFVVNTTFLSTGDTLVMQGEIDWVHHEGHAFVSGKGAESGVVEVYWTQIGRAHV